MIYNLVFRRYAPFKSFGGGFEGDDRQGPTTSLIATARTTGIITFAPGNAGHIQAFSSGTSFVGGGAKVQEMLGHHLSKVTSSVTVTTRTIQQIRLTALTSGANPMIPGAPAIDTYIDLSVGFRTMALELSGTVRGDDFPNAEIFVIDAKGRSSPVFAFATTGGRSTGPMLRLAGANSGKILGEFSCKVPTMSDGAFKINNDFNAVPA